MTYADLKNIISAHLNSAAEDFFLVGYYLRQVNEKSLYKEDGYESIWEFAKGEFNLSTSSASRFMAINSRFSIDGGEHMAEKYIGMGVSKLQEMLGLPDEELEKVTKQTTVREIRAMKAAAKEPLSYFGLRKTVRPEGSLNTVPGCGDGKYSCFLCIRTCEIRQEPRRCRFSNYKNENLCILNDEKWKKNMQFSLFKNECQMLHFELAPKRAGDGEPDACCQNCQNKTCFNRCDVARDADEAERKRQQEEAEARKPEPSEEDIKAFYDWHGFKVTDAITGDSLKQEYRNAGGGGGSRLKDYDGSQRGVRINYKREITWAQLARRLKEIQEKELKRLEPKKEKEPDIIDADFTEVEESEEQKELRETCDHEGEYVEEKEQDDGCMVYEEKETEEVEPDPEYYDISDIEMVLRKEEKDLKAYRDVGGLPPKLMREKRILVDALTLFLREIEKMDGPELLKQKLIEKEE